MPAREALLMLPSKWQVQPVLFYCWTNVWLNILSLSYTHHRPRDVWFDIIWQKWLLNCHHSYIPRAVTFYYFSVWNDRAHGTMSTAKLYKIYNPKSSALFDILNLSRTLSKLYCKYFLYCYEIYSYNSNLILEKIISNLWHSKPI